MEWKQPIPTNFVDICNGDKFSATVFVVLLLRASNKEKFYYFEDNKVLLKRGQCFCGRFELGEYFGLKRKKTNKVWRALEKLQKADKLIDKQKTRNGSIITILNYDSLSSFEQTNRQSIDNQKSIKSQSKDTNKSDKSDKNDKNEKKENGSPEII